MKSLQLLILVSLVGRWRVSAFSTQPHVSHALTRPSGSSSKSLTMWQSNANASSDDTYRGDDDRPSGVSGDPYISPLLDSMSRRLRRLQRLDDQNDFIECAKGSSSSRLPDRHPTERSGSNNNQEGQTATKSGNKEIRKDVIGVRAGRIDDYEQQNSVEANAPAVLLQSGPGTGKSSVLAARIAHLLKSGQCQPENLVVLSFTNRDAAAIKERALRIMFPDKQEKVEDARKDLGAKIWSGTLHSFASAILKKYGGDGGVRIIASKEMRNMVKRSISRLIGSSETSGTRLSLTIDNDNRITMHRRHLNNALGDCNRNLNTVAANIVRCIELWKEMNYLPPPLSYRMNIGNDRMAASYGEEMKRDSIRQDCVEQAVRWGIPESAATLALDVYPEYQNVHASAGTADPSDLAALARDLLLTTPTALSALRTKLGHVILDEYQDISVAQHALLRLVLRGQDAGPVKMRASRHYRSRKENICYDVPRLFCAGDANQSLYGWRGAVPTRSIERFLSDYPQGVVVPLGTNYRLPRKIMEAAALLVSTEDGEQDGVTTFVTSPAAGTSVSSNLMKNGGLNSDMKKDCSAILNKILLESDSTISIQELWDAREESKFIAASVRKNSKERLRRCSNALFELVDRRVPSSPSSVKEEWSLFDPTDVAIVVRSSAQLKLIEEMLAKHSIPYARPDTDTTSSPFTRRDTASSPISRNASNSKDKSLRMKPVRLVTMHQCKGDEFDDVYLCGWNEGTFPHPLSISSGRLDEERRLAYVALTRARQRVTITYPANKRSPYIGPLGERKLVSSQIQPSRFLNELVPNKTLDNRKQKITWNDDYGFKYSIAGKDLPDHFAKSYEVPEGYRTERNDRPRKYQNSANVQPQPRRRSDDGVLETSITTLTARRESIAAKGEEKKGNVALREFADEHEEAMQVTTKVTHQSAIKNEEEDNDVERGGEHLLSLIQHALIEMNDLKVKGACKLYTQSFKDMLKDFGISRGVALVFVDRKRSDSTSVHELVNASDDEVTTKALSKCTARELAHFLSYLILSVGNTDIE